jgi:hypothetical protein
MFGDGLSEGFGVFNQQNAHLGVRGVCCRGIGFDPMPHAGLRSTRITIRKTQRQA